MVVYTFYYTESEITDHDSDGAVYSDVQNDLPGAFVDLQSGLDYYKYKYPTKNIQYKTFEVMDCD